MNDLRYAFRQLSNSSAFTATAVLTLALAIGVNSAVFTLVDHLVLRPVILDRPEQVVSVNRHLTSAGPQGGWEKWSYRDLDTIESAHELFADVAAVRIERSYVGLQGDVRGSYVGRASGNYFDFLGAKLLRGRMFSPEEARPEGGSAVLIASYPLWQRYNLREDFVGSAIRVGNIDYTVIGIAAPGFNGTALWPSVQAWLPLGSPNSAESSTPGPTIGQKDRRTEIFQDITGLTLLARLQPTLTPAAAEARSAVLTSRLGRTDDEAGSDFTIHLMPPDRFNMYSGSGQKGPWLMVAVPVCLLAATVLLIASLNLASLLLARGIHRRKEIVVRLAMGATRSRVIRQLLVEGLVLALLGSALGLLAAQWSNSLLLRSVGGLLDRYWFTLNLDATLDARIVLATLAYGVLAMLVFSLWPALHTTRLDLNVVLNSQNGQSSGADRWQRFFSPPHCLAMAQVTISLVLLYIAASILHLQIMESQRPLGFEAEGRWVTTIEHRALPPNGTPLQQRLESMRSMAEYLPGVERAVLTTSVPFSLSARSRKVRAVGLLPETSDLAKTANSNAIYAGIGQGFFETLGIQLLRGRDFTSAEIDRPDGTSAAIIDETLAKRLFGELDPLGQQLTWDEATTGNVFTVVGLIRSPAQTFTEKLPPARIYLPLHHPALPGSANFQLGVKLSNAADPIAFRQAFARSRRELDPELAIGPIQPLHDFVAEDIEFVALRVATWFMGIFGAVALLLTAIGNFGIKTYLLANRTKEIGIRMALGASGGRVVGQFMRQSLLQIALACGVGAIPILSFGLRLNDTKSSWDFLSLGGVVLLLLVTLLLASWLPTRRAVRIDPMEALRAE